jgi:hypothetical protein
VRLWDAKSGEGLGALKVPEGWVSSVAFSPDGRQIATGNVSGTVRLWDARNGAAIGGPLKGHEGWVSSVAFSPDGRQIASGSSDRTVRLWDARSGAAIGPPLKGHEGYVWSVGFGPDGRQLASGSEDGTVRRWIASPQEWFRLACSRMRYHPLLRDPASISTDQEMILAGKRANQACQLASRRAARAQHQGASHGLAGLLAWARGLMP